MTSLKKINENFEALRDESLRKQLTAIRREIESCVEHIVNGRRLLAEHKRILKEEIGDFNRPPTQKSRKSEANNLKSLLISVLDKGKITPVISREIGHREQLVNQHELNAYKIILNEVAEKGPMKDVLQSYFDVRQKYETALKNNTSLVSDVNLTRKRISEVVKENDQNKQFIQHLAENGIRQQQKELEMMYIVYKNQPPTEAPTKSKSDSQLQLYKRLWEKNISEQATVKARLQALGRKLQKAQRRLLDAEDACAENTSRVQKMIEQSAQRSISPPGSPTQPVPYKILRQQTLKAEGENRCLKSFLRKSVLSQEPEFRKLLRGLQSTADRYRQEVEKFRPVKPPTPPPEEPKAKKKKKKKGKKKK